MQSVVTGTEFTLVLPRPESTTDSTSKDVTDAMNLVTMRLIALVLFPVEYVVHWPMNRRVVLTEQKRAAHISAVSTAKKLEVHHTKVTPHHHPSVRPTN